MSTLHVLCTLLQCSNHPNSINGAPFELQMAPKVTFPKFDFALLLYTRCPNKQDRTLTLIAGPKNNHIKQVLGSFLTPT